MNVRGPRGTVKGYSAADAESPERIRTAVSRAETIAQAAREIADQLLGHDTSFVFAFLPGGIPPAELNAALGAALPGITIFGCTTAGQITSRGYEDDALLVIAFPRRHFRVASHLFAPLGPVAIGTVARDAARLALRFPERPDRRRLAIILADGLSKHEDMFVAAVHAGLGAIPVFGGSAADALRFDRTHVLYGGEVHESAGLLVLLETDLDFQSLGFHHFSPTPQRMVVTAALPEERLVLELNGAPAAQEYSRLVGRGIDRLSPLVFAENPVLVRSGNAYHVRAIQEIHANGGLTFLSAIDTGLPLTLGRGKAIIETLEAGLSVTDDAGCPPDFILGFDCFLRKLEIEQKGLRAAASEVLGRSRIHGFNTYGEQHLGVHVNQTFVGVAFFETASGAGN